MSSALRFERTVAWLPSASPECLARAETHGEIECSSIRGVNMLGYFSGQFGLAEAARLYARAVMDSGTPVALYDIDLDLPHGWEDRSLERWIGKSLPHDVSIVFANPDYLQAALESVGSDRVKGHYIIACWFWELERIPDDWLWALDRVDEIMVASEFVAEAFAKVTNKPVTRVPLPLIEPVDGGLQRADFGIEEDRFVFLCTFDFNSWIARKNPFAVIDAFGMAFPEDRSDVRLLIKSSNGFRYPEHLRRLINATRGDPRIILRDDVIAGSQMTSLQRCCDAYVSLHRSEGFGLGMAESMFAGKPVIATGWSGNTDFMDSQNSCLVGYRLVPLLQGEYPSAHGQRWAEADRKEAADWMRRLVDTPGLAAAIGRRARASVIEALAPSRAAAVLAERISRVADPGSRGAPPLVTADENRRVE